MIDPTARSEALAVGVTVTLVGLTATFRNWPAPEVRAIDGGECPRSRSEYVRIAYASPAVGAEAVGEAQVERAVERRRAGAWSWPNWPLAGRPPRTTPSVPDAFWE